MGLGAAMLIAMYDFLGYYDICYVGGEVRNPERVIPRAIMYSVVGVALIYAVMNLWIIAVVPCGRPCNPSLSSRATWKSCMVLGPAAL